MRLTSAAALLAFASTAALAADMPDPAAPKGLLPDAATPSAYRLDLTIDPEQPRFSGHAEIDATVKTATKKLYMHGRDLHVTRAVAIVGGKPMPATYAQVEDSGVVRLDFATPLPAGKVTLAFDYDAAFGDNPAGLYRIKVADHYYSWTQFESIDARDAFPSFDQPGYKTPFTISVTTKPGNRVVSNAPEASVTKAGALEKHQFAPTKPLPTYLVAFATGPFVGKTGAVPADTYRKAPLPLGVVATQPQADKLDYVMAETPRIVSLLEAYFGQPFPFPKLDQIASPVEPGAMENAGADTYGDSIILLDKGASTVRRKVFGEVVAHELAHQWFGDLVSPAWWDDIWLNESFANWMGYRIGNEWRPELKIGVGAIDDALAAMNTDALEVGRPIHQPITENGQIDSTFDTITYGKGGQVIAMIAAYMGDEKFRDGVRLHLSRHMYGNASSAQFYQALADAAHDPRIVTALKSFTEQQGVPVVSFRREGGTYVVSQKRYAFLGSNPPPLTWTIPLCFRNGDAGGCELLDRPSMTIKAVGSGPMMPNRGGQGYYRFDLSAPDWAALIADTPHLSGAEVLAVNDSLWAGFRAGTVPAATLVAAAKTTAAHPDSVASIDGGSRLAGLMNAGLIDAAAVPAYRKLIEGIYAPKLAALGFDPKAGAYAAEDPDRQKNRQDIALLLAGEAHDESVRAKMLAAANAYLAGDKDALDQSMMRVSLGLQVEAGGVPAAKAMMERALGSEDAVFRASAIGSLTRSGRQDIADWLFGFQDKRLRNNERLAIVSGLAAVPATREQAVTWILANYDDLVAKSGIFFGSRLPGVLNVECSAERADAIDKELGPKVAKLNIGVLEFQRTVERIRHCGMLKQAKQGEIAAALNGAQ